MYNFLYTVSILRGISKNSSGDRILLRSMLESVSPTENQKRHVNYSTFNRRWSRSQSLMTAFKSPGREVRHMTTALAARCAMNKAGGRQKRGWSLPSVIQHTVKKRLATFQSPSGMSPTKLSLSGKNVIIPAQGEFGKRHPGWGRECR